MTLKSPVVLIIGALVIAVVGFFGGMQYQKMQTGSSRNVQFGNRQNGGGRFAMMNNGGMQGRPVIGQILSLDDKTMTVKMMDGSSKIVILPDNMTISKTDSGSKADLKVGENIGVFGQANSDGSVTAQNVQLNPMFRTFGASGSAQPNPQSR
jgi:hypothetical protein